MQTSLSLSSLIALSIAMVIGAAVPSLSVITVASRSASYGFVHGALTTVGIVLGDLIYILIAITGLTVLAENLGGVFDVVKYLGGAYLIWLGVNLWRFPTARLEASLKPETSLSSSFLAGLLLTLADQKAILFYLGFFPAFVNLATISILDTGMIITIAILTVGGTKLGYAYMANRASLLVSGKRSKVINICAGGVMIIVGTFVILKA